MKSYTQLNYKADQLTIIIITALYFTLQIVSDRKQIQRENYKVSLGSIIATERSLAGKFIRKITDYNLDNIR